MKYIIPSLIVLLFATRSFAQMPSVIYDYELNRLTENQPLPSETDFMVMGTLPEGVNFVQVSIFTDNGRDDRNPITVGVWKEPFKGGDGTFRVPITDPLPSGKKFDVQIDYFAPVDPADLEAIYDQLVTYVRSYLYQSFEIKKKKIVLRNSSKQTFYELNALVEDGLRRYRSTTEPLFEGFSDIVRFKLEEADGIETTYEYNQPTRDSVSGNVVIARRLPDALEDLNLFVLAELKFALSKDLSERVDSRYLDNYKADKGSGFIGLNLGYGAVFFGDQFSNNDNGFFLGLDYPLASSGIAPKFFRNASIGFGVFTSNMEDQDNHVITGPVINRPFYLALEYKLLYFIRLNLGAAVLEREAVDNGVNKAVFVRPFVGLSARLNLAVSLDN